MAAEGDKGRCKGKKGKGKGKHGTNCVYGVDDYYGAEDGGGPLAWADEQWAAESGADLAGAVFETR